MNGKTILAHRLSYQLFKGPIPDGLHVLHKCDVTECVNPEHLFVGTNLENITDSVSKGRRKGVPRNRPSGLKYKFTPESKAKWIADRQKIKHEDRLKIRVEYDTGAFSQRELASKYGVTQATINRIVK
jgi:hypothetical protein